MIAHGGGHNLCFGTLQRTGWVSHHPGAVPLKGGSAQDRAAADLLLAPPLEWLLSCDPTFSTPSDAGIVLSPRTSRPTSMTLDDQVTFQSPVFL
jgi:hypothetical protein